MDAGGFRGEAGGGSEGEKKKMLEGEGKKRKMKTASQLEILEKTYTVEAYPSEPLRAELSVKLGLSDRQLQMWFCHRRLKDRKAPLSGKRPVKDPPAAAGRIGASGEEMVAVEIENELPSGSGSGSSPFGHGVDLRARQVGHQTGVAVARIGGDVVAIKRYYEPPQSITELRAISFVEAQLGEPLKENGPILGMEFDPLPPDAFGSPIAPTLGQQRQGGRPFEAKLYELPDSKLMKGSVRTLHEYQFLPEQPTVRNDAYERAAPSYRFDSPSDVPTLRTSSLSTGRSFVHGNEQLSSGYGIQNQMHNLNPLPRGRHSPHLASAEYDNVGHKNSFMNIDVDAHFGVHPITTLENPFVLSDKRIINNEDALRIEKKRKGDEVRIAREVEAHEKRIRKELEKQDLLRRKREEQIRKEMERQDRERRKEEERQLREKQREEEKYQREQKREMERRDKFLQKESIRAEKMRHKEEIRRTKEAARLKAANERAIARKIAKESMELIQDERLELMELAAASKGLPSILSLDFETIQNLELFKNMLTLFPPNTVQLRKPFSVHPWIDSEENVGNLLMVWRFLITFADVLGLWPFTLDEFIQAFHEYDPRLLGEIHVSLLQSIIKDIEDVARSPSNGLGANQNGASNPGGGHRQIVQGAYAWGFDIRSWQHHLNPLTWPEILRQFVLSAGFGPKLKRRDTEQSHLRVENEGNDGRDVISNLRDGAAAENALAIMRERGFSNMRRSRHCLTPGTVKYAAFHVLSVEGSKGLTILEVADRIQKSGLRDLTTSKTPEASIAAALSRDTKLFERIAPSTYCVRPAYRKDSADAESLLSAARDRIQIFKSGFLDVEEADAAERDEDSESDVAEDPEVDDLGTELNPENEYLNRQGAVSYKVHSLLGNGKEVGEVMKTQKGDLGNDDGGFPSVHSEGCTDGAYVDQSVGPSGIGSDAMNIDQEDTVIDESNPGEPWVQGLMEGEYSDLCVEERLNAIVALIGVAIEGNSIRVILEERLEAASALKKQMWAEAQVDKRRFKEEYIMKTHYSSSGNRVEPYTLLSSAEGRQSPLVNFYEKNEAPVDPVVKYDRSGDPHNDLDNLPSEGTFQMQDFSTVPENILIQQQAAEKSRSQLKFFIGHKAEEMYVYRSLPLGLDRRRNRYWQFMTSTSLNDPGCGRIFVELHNGHWRLIDSEQGFDTLLASLDLRGVRESNLHSMLQRIEFSFKETVRRNMQYADLGWHIGDTVKKKSVDRDTSQDCSIGVHNPCSNLCLVDSEMSDTSRSFSIELGRNETLRRYQDFEKWMWKECSDSSALYAIKYGKKRCMPLLASCDYCHNIFLLEENHCPSCHKTYGTLSDISFSEHVTFCEKKEMVHPNDILWCTDSSPVRIRLLKLQLALIEESIPPEALQHVWTDCYRKSWAAKLHASSSAKDLLQVLTLLEHAIRRDYLSFKFETTTELLGSSRTTGSIATDYSNPEMVPVLPWVPQTTGAVSLRIREFDSSITYVLHQEMESREDSQAADFMKFPSNNVENDTQCSEIAETSHQLVLREENWFDAGIGLAGSDRRRGNRGKGRGRIRGGSSQRRVIRSRSDSVMKGNANNSERSGQALGWKERPRGRGSFRRGRRSVRSRQKPAKTAVRIVGPKDASKETILEESKNLLKDEQNGRDGVSKLHVDGAENASSSDRSDYYKNGLASGDEYDDVVVDEFVTGFNGRSDDLLEGSDYNVEVEDDNDDDEDEYIIGDTDEEDNGTGDAPLNRDMDENTGPTSTDYSD